MALTDDDVREILRLIDESELEELRVERNGFKLHVVRGGAASPVPEPPAPDRDPSTISAPMQGTFYRAEAPGKEPFVDVGSHVDPDTVVGIVEIMKMMNAIPAGVSGTIVEVCADDAQVIKEGEALFRVQ
jgi:acetyl-CoA carboxylase biotin carboxyl carrier protein